MKYKIVLTSYAHGKKPITELIQRLPFRMEAQEYAEAYDEVMDDYIADRVKGEAGKLQVYEDGDIISTTWIHKTHSHYQ